VLDAGRLEAAWVIGSQSGYAAILLAATHPERVEALDPDVRYAADTPTDDYIPGTEPDSTGCGRDSTLHRSLGDGTMIHTLFPYARENVVYRRLAPERSSGRARVLVWHGHAQCDVGLRRHSRGGTRSTCRRW